MTYTDLTPGTPFMYEGKPYIVVSGEFHRMQMRKAVMRTTIRDLMTNQLLTKTFSASDRFDPAAVEKLSVQYLYRDADTFYFMDKETFEQYHGSAEILGEKTKFLSENLEISLIVYNHNPVQLILPSSVNLKVMESPNAIKGDSVSSSFKIVVCENGIKVSCPLFVKESDLIKIDTETGGYLGRS